MAKPSMRCAGLLRHRSTRSLNGGSGQGKMKKQAFDKIDGGNAREHARPAFEKAGPLSVVQAEAILNELAGVFSSADFATRQPVSNPERAVAKVTEQPSAAARYRTLVEQI